MKISFRGDYAMKALLDLALFGGGDVVPIQDIAKRQDIPMKYLGQIMLSLKGAGYIVSRRGSRGGYSLARDPQAITLGEIVRLTEGPVSPITCVSKSCYTRCAEEVTCVFRPVWDEVRRRTEDIVDNTTFADLVERYRTLKHPADDSLDYSVL